MDCSPPGSLVHGIFQARITGVGCHFLLQGVFLTQGSNSGLLHFRQTLYPLSHQGIPNMAWHTHKILELHTEEKLEGILDVYVGPGEKFISIYFYDEKNIAIWHVLGYEKLILTTNLNILFKIYSLKNLILFLWIQLFFCLIHFFKFFATFIYKRFYDQNGLHNSWSRLMIISSNSC